MRKEEKKSCAIAGRILQNVYLTPARTAVDLNTSNESSKYFELRRVTVSDGVKEELVEVDYPITAEYVNSFSDSADYKKDISGAIANSDNTRKNLGDILDAQRVLGMGQEDARNLTESLRNLATALEQKQNIKSEVKNENEVSE